MKAYAPSSKSVQRSTLPKHAKPERGNSTPAAETESATWEKQTDQSETPVNEWGTMTRNVMGAAAGETLRGRSGLVVQRKMTLGEVGDRYEEEADRLAPQLVRQINSSDFGKQPNNAEAGLKGKTPTMQLQALRPTLQLKGESTEGSVSPAIESAIHSSRGGGQPLEPRLQQRLGQMMEVDFSGVRVHTDARADQLNQALNARAFTTGQDLFFKQGEYQPGNWGGQELIAHELTHAVQQGVSTSNNGTSQAAYSPTKPINRTPIVIQRFTWKDYKKSGEQYLDKKIEAWDKRETNKPGSGIKAANKALEQLSRLESKGHSSNQDDGLLIEAAQEKIEKWIKNHSPTSGIHSQPDEKIDDTQLGEKINAYLPDDRLNGRILQVKKLISGLKKRVGDVALMVKHIEEDEKRVRGYIEDAKPEETGLETEFLSTSAGQSEEVGASLVPSQTRAQFGDEKGDAPANPLDSVLNSVPFELEMTFASVSVSREKFIGLETSGSIKKGFAEGSYEAKLGASASGSASASVGPRGLDAKASASVTVGATVTVKGKLDLTKKSSGIVLEGEANIKLGGGAEAEAHLGLTPTSLNAGFNAEAFLGLKGDAKATGTLKIFGRDIFEVTGSVSGSLGLGADAQGQLRVDAIAGGMRLGFGVSATVGLGAGASLEHSLNFRNVVLVSYEGVDRLLSPASRGYESINTNEQALTMKYNAMIEVLEKYKAPLEKRLAEVDSGDESTPLLPTQ